MSHEQPVKKRQRIEASDLSSSSTSTSSSSSIDLDPESSVENEWLDALQTRQCLCGVAEPRRPFQRYIVAEIIATDKLDEWPSEQLLKFLSAIQMFFDLYLKQNRHGTICAKAVDVVQGVVAGQGLNLVEDLLQLVDRRLACKGADDTKFCLYLAARVISHYLIIVKDQDAEQRWLKKIVDNLFIFDTTDATGSPLNSLAIRKICFSLDVIKYIIEFKDMEEHPLEDGGFFDALPLPPIETNYFAQQFLAGAGDRTAAGSTSSEAVSLIYPNFSF